MFVMVHCELVAGFVLLLSSRYPCSNLSVGVLSSPLAQVLFADHVIDAPEGTLVVLRVLPPVEKFTACAVAWTLPTALFQFATGMKPVTSVEPKAAEPPLSVAWKLTLITSPL